jgi:tryptophan synthase beta chain
VKYLLDESRLPREWYNIVADLPRLPEPVLHPGTLQPIGPADLEPLFPMALIAQEVATERAIEIPEPVREVYGQWCPSPLYRACRLERALDTPAKIRYTCRSWPPSL